MEMIVLNHDNELCTYPRLCLKSLPPKTQKKFDKPVCFTHANVLLSYVNETVSSLGNMPFFSESNVNHFYGPRALTLCQCYLKLHAVGEGPLASL